MKNKEGRKVGEMRLTIYDLSLSMESPTRSTIECKVKGRIAGVVFTAPLCWDIYSNIISERMWAYFAGKLYSDETVTLSEIDQILSEDTQ